MHLPSNRHSPKEDGKHVGRPFDKLLYRKVRADSGSAFAVGFGFAACLTGDLSGVYCA